MGLLARLQLKVSPPVSPLSITCLCVFRDGACSRVRALVLPFVADLDESAVTGTKMPLADAHTIKNCR